MKIDAHRLVVDESKSNPMQVAMAYPECPIKAACFHMVVGFGTVTNICSHFDSSANNEDKADCTWKAE